VEAKCAVFDQRNLSSRSLFEVGLDTLAELRERREEILATAHARGAFHIRVFGSVARGEDSTDSDVDFLVELEPTRTLLDLGGLVMDLRDLLQREVDVVTEAGLRPRVAARVMADAVEL
jgi:predicted nucleotidyltransferase